MGPWGALIGAGLGAIQYGDKKRQHEHDKNVAAETARYSPWTGMKPQAVEGPPSLMGTVGQGALSGFGFGQQFGGAAGGPGALGQAGGAAAVPPEAAALSAPQSQDEYAQANPFAAGPRMQQGNPWALPNPYAPPGFGN